jgi:BirA family biotin operon repressor/biotin-[acetyl-CoA-carboxylase] ligase
VNLYLSVVLRPPLEPWRAPVLGLGIAASLAEAFDLRVKWPNDLVDEEGRKLGGLLLEMETRQAAIRYIVLGLGLNVNQTAFPDLPNATSLAVRHGERALAAVETAALSAVLAGKAELDLWRARSHTLGRHVRVGEVEGIASEIREDGALVVGGVAVTTGELA